MADESKYPTRIAPYGLRMSPELKARVQQSADEAGRSLHAELIHTLEEKYPAPEIGFDLIAKNILRKLLSLPEEERRDFVKQVSESFRNISPKAWDEANEKGVDLSELLLSAIEPTSNEDSDNLLAGQHNVDKDDN